MGHKYLSSLLALWAITIPLGCTSKPAIPSKKETKFLRFVETGKASGRLETAIVTYKNTKGVTVDLIGVVHLGETYYYRALQGIFRKYDALLYELVASPTKRPGRDTKATGLMSTLQKSFGQSMNLAFQLENIDYNKKNFVHADLTPAQFAKAWKDKGESLWKIMVRTMLVQARLEQQGKGSKLNTMALLVAMMSKNRAERLKFLLAREFEKIELTLAGIGGGKKGEKGVLLGSRNEAAINVMKKQMIKGKKRMAIFYGAAHMPDLEDRLVLGLGFKKTKQKWITAWHVGAPPETAKKTSDK